MNPTAHDAVAVTVTCRDGDGAGVRHRVVVRSDGSVATPDHDNEPWGADARVLEHLDPTTHSAHACDWWVRGSTRQARPVVVGWGQGVIIVNGSAVFDPTEWEIVTVGLVSAAARDTVFDRFALEGREREPDMPVEQIIDTVILLASWAQRDGRLMMTPSNREYLSLPRIQNFVRSASRQQMVELLALGVPWYAIPGLRSLGMDSEHTARAYELMAATDSGRRLEWYTGMPRDIELATEMGITQERLISFLERRSGRGPVWEARVIRQKIEDALTGVTGIDNAWIAEAVASLPDQPRLTERYGADVASLCCNGDWQHLLVHDVAADTAILMLQTLGDPAGWPEGWEFPSNDEIEMARVRMSRSQTSEEPTQ